MPTISIVSPCYNEEANVVHLYERITAVFKTCPNYAYEILFIDNASTDNTVALIKSLAEKDSHVRLIVNVRNFGHIRSPYHGLLQATGDAVILMASDLQDPPELIPEMIRTMETSHAQVVYCVRKSRKGEGFFKKITAKLFYRFLNFLSEVRLPVDTGDFRLIDKSIIREFNNLHEKGKYIRGLISWVGFKQVPFYYEREARFAGETKYPFMKMLRFATTSMLYFSTKPLRIATTLGFTSVLVALALAIWSILGKIIGFTHADSGWTSLFVLIIFFGGVQLLTIGIVGSYIGNLFDEIKNRPEYIILKKENFESNIEDEKNKSR